MRTKAIIALTIFLVLRLLTGGLFAASGEPDANRSVVRSWDGFLLPPNGSYRALIIYVNIIYDAGVPDPIGTNDIWAQTLTEGINVDTASWPVYMNDFIDVEYTAGNAHGMFTKLFAESSFENLIITGDFMVVNIKHTSVSQGDEFTSIPMLDSVMNLINRQGGLNTLYGHNSIVDYATIDTEKFDYVKFIIRNSRPGYGDYGVGNGTAGSGEWIRLKTSEGGLFSAYQSSIQCVGANNIALNPTSILVHEFSHLIFGPNSFHTSGGHSWGGRMCFLGIQYGYGLMGGASSGLVNCNGFDRYRAGWMSSENTSGWPITAGGMISDISKDDGNQSFILRDFITTSDVVRIRLPYISKPASSQYIWLENHKIPGNTLNFLQYSNTHPDCRPQAQKGIYAYYQVGKDTLEGDRTAIFPGYDTDNLKIICANGFYDAAWQGTIPGDCIGTGPFDYFIDFAPNPLAGNNDLSAYFIDIPGDDTLKPGIHAKNAMAKTYYNFPADTIRNLPYLMSGINPFHGASEMSLSTNPAPFNTTAWYHNPSLVNNIRVTKPVDVFRNVPEVYLSGLKIVMSPLDNDDYKVDISWDNYELENDVRWTGIIVLSEELYVNEGVTLLLDQNRTPATIYRDQTSGLFSPPTQMRCADGSFMVQRPGSNVVVDNKSTLLLEAGSLLDAEGGLLRVINESMLQVASGGVFKQQGQSTVAIESLSTLLIEQGGHYIIDGGLTKINPGGRLEIESCATIEIRNGGLLSFESLAEICIHPGAFFLLDSVQNLHFGFGYSTGGCLGFTPANFEEVVIASPPTNIIHGVTNWHNATYNFTQDLVIDSAAVLNLGGGSLLRFGPGKKIYVKKGATFNLADSKITNLCASQSWGGTEVWGDAGKSQMEQGSQGKIIISERSVIENAVIGVLAGKVLNEPDNSGMAEIDPAYSGGIVIANSSEFRNNQTGIYLAPYENRHPETGQILSNASHIDNCTFTGTSELFTSICFIRLNGVRGLSISRCSFTGFPGLNTEATGILSLNSGFTVKEYCFDRTIPCQQITPCRFENLRYGIWALGTGSEKTFTVDSAHFINNTIGIYTSANHHFSVVRSLFKIQNLSIAAPRKSGLYVDGPVLGFQVTENRFAGTYAGISIGSGISFGATFNNTGTYSNLLYNNRFDSLHIATLAMNQNRDPFGFTGLCIKCNEFGLNRHAIMVLHDTTSYGYGGIAPYQGSPESSIQSPAGNTFRPSALWESHIYNFADPVLYFFPEPGLEQHKLEPDKITPDSVFVFQSNQGFSKPESCPPDLPDWFGQNYLILREAYDVILNQVRTKEAEYEQLIDDGDTELLLTKLHFSHPADGLQTLKTLLGLSPWLSDTVLIKAIKLRHLLPEVMLRDILAANPQAAKSRRVLNAITSYSGQIPDLFKDAIAKGQQQISAREALEAEILSHKVELQKALLRLSHFLMNDTLQANAHDRLLSQFLEQPTQEFWYIAAMMHMEKGNIFDASGVLNAIPPRFGFGPEHNPAHGKVKALIEKMYFLSLEGKNLHLTDSANVQWLLGIKNSGHEPAATFARNILIAIGTIDYEPRYLVPMQVGPPPVKPPVPPDETTQLPVMKIFPNPALNYIIVDYDVTRLSGSQNETPYLTITGLDGKQLDTKQLPGKQNQALIPLGYLPAGIYMVNIHYGGKRVESLRIVII